MQNYSENPLITTKDKSKRKQYQRNTEHSNKVEGIYLIL